MHQQTLYIMTGLPYSGKTTLRQELVKRFGFSVVSIDEIMDERNMWSEGHPSQEDWNVAYSEAYTRLKKHLTASQSVIFDGGNLPFRERETPRQIARELSVRSKLIYVNTPREEILRRRLKNEETKERGQLDKRELETALNMFEKPTPEENPVVYSQEVDLDSWIRNNIG